ncbi:MAG TPA: hypothetical protein VGN95_07195 [Pyrinomonadaceae bacterium]|jgi:hypothetical protein|nr:hypothetical protein [Pyrinomonadaceae bacterium]
MSKFTVAANISEVERLGKDYQQAAEVGMRQLVERGEQVVREEAPEAKDKAFTNIGGNLKQGVSSDVKPRRGGILQGEIIVTARSGRLARRDATLHLASGKTKTVSLRAVPSFNYAEAVATGTGVFGPKGVAITPKKAKVLLIPVSSVPMLDGKLAPYIESSGQIYIVRRSMKGMQPNPYDERAARRLEQEAPGIFDNAIKQFVGGQP